MTSAGWNMALTGGLLLVAFLQLLTYRRQANLMRGQLALMEADRRPWIALEMTLFHEPLIKDDSGSHLVIAYKLNNVGKSAAFNVDFIAEMIPWGDPQPSPPTAAAYSIDVPTSQINETVERVCTALQHYRSEGWGDIMFPNIPQNGRWRVNTKVTGPGFVHGFFIVGCVTYRSVNDSIVHRTARVFELSKRAYAEMIDLSAGTIPVSELAFTPHRRNGSRAT